MTDAMYSAVLLPAVRYHPQLSAEAKLIFCEMSACVDENQCMADDEEYFARNLNISLALVHRAFGELQQYGFIKNTETQGQIWVNL